MPLPVYFPLRLNDVPQPQERSEVGMFFNSKCRPFSASIQSSSAPLKISTLGRSMPSCKLSNLWMLSNYGKKNKLLFSRNLAYWDKLEGVLKPVATSKVNLYLQQLARMFFGELLQFLFCRYGQFESREASAQIERPP